MNDKIIPNPYKLIVLKEISDLYKMNSIKM